MSIAQTQVDAPWSLFAPGAQRNATANSGSTGRGNGLPPAPTSANRNGAYADAEERRMLRNAGIDPSSADRNVQTGYSDDFFGEDGFTFSDFVDIINPLQHIPGVSTVYRELSGDEISQGARLAGGTLYGGPLGLGAAIANNAFEAQTGKDIGATAMAFLLGDESAPTGPASDAVAFAADADLGANGSLSSNPTAEQLANLAPAAGATSAGTTAILNQALPLNASSGNPSISNQTVATEPVARRNGAAGGIAPTGFVTPAPQSVSKAAPARIANSQPQVFDAGGTAGNAQKSVAQSSSNAKEATLGPAPTRGPATLSPAAAQRLMEMAQRSSAGPTNTTTPAASPPAASPPAASPPAASPPAASPLAAPSPVRPEAPPPPAIAEPMGTEAQDDIAAFAPPEPQDIPNAMLPALRKYEAMKQNPG